MAEDALKRFNGKAKPYFQRPFKINWGIKKNNPSTQPQPTQPAQFQPTQDPGPQRSNLNNFLTPNSFNLLNRNSTPLNKDQRIQAATLKALGLCGDVEYQPTPLSTTNTNLGQGADSLNANKNVHPIFKKKRMPIAIDPATYNPDNPISIYVGDLDRNCDHMRLENIFRQFYTTVVGAKIIKDPSTRMSKGYGFVMFASPEEADTAIEEMHGFQILNRKIRTGKSMSKSGMAPIRGSGNGCGMMGNGLTSLPQKNLPESNQEKPKAEISNVAYPGMVMFNNMGYPVSYSQYYNFNMINMPYPYMQGAEQQEHGNLVVNSEAMMKQQHQVMSEQMGMGVAGGNGEGGFSSGFGGGPSSSAQMNPMEMMAGQFYTHGYPQVYGNPGFYMDSNNGGNQKSEVHGKGGNSALLNKRSDQNFQNNDNKIESTQSTQKPPFGKTQKSSENSQDDLSKLIEKASEESEKETEKTFAGLSGWFSKKKETDKESEREFSEEIADLVSEKFDWFCTPQVSCNKFLIEFHDL